MTIRTTLVACVLVLIVATGGVVGTIGAPTDHSSPTAQTETTTLTQCTTITTSGTYVLSQDIGPATGTDPCLRVDANEVTIDGNGYTINGDIRVGDTDRTEFYRGLTLRNVTADFVSGEALFDLTVTSSDLNDGIEALFFTNVTVTDSRLGGSGIVFSEQGTNIIVENNTFDGEEGIGLFERVQNARLVDNTFALTGLTERPVSYAVFLSSTSGTTRDVLVADNRIDGAGGDGVVVVEGGTDIDVLRNNITNASEGIEYLAAGGTIAENDISGNDVGIGLYAVEPVDDVIDVLVQNNRITDNRVGIFSESIVDTDGLRVRDNLIAGNSEFGVNNIGQSLVDARNNDWGDASGPSSAPANDSDAPFADPVTGLLADGSGDAVSEGTTSGVSNVRFDPVTGEDVDQPTTDEPTTEAPTTETPTTEAPTTEPPTTEEPATDVPTEQPTDEPIDEPTEEPTPEDSSDRTYFQVDFIVGEPKEQVGPENGFYSDENRLIRFAHGVDGEQTRGGSVPTLAADAASCLDAGYVTTHEDNTATVSFTVEEGCELTLSLVSYEKPGPGFDRDVTQELVDSSTDTFGPGEYTLTVDLPASQESEDEESAQSLSPSPGTFGGITALGLLGLIFARRD